MTPSTDEHSRGWHVDPFGRFEYRYFNGVRWTADVANHGRRMVDDYGTTMPPPRRPPMPAGDDPHGAGAQRADRASAEPHSSGPQRSDPQSADPRTG